MNLMRKKWFLSFGLLFLVILLLAACATGSPSDSSDESSDDNKDDDNSVTVSFDENIQTLDPHDGSSGNDISVTNTMYESMYTPDEDGELQPLLATDYEEDDDGLNYTFELRDDVKFNDGTEFDAEAVKANLDRILDSDGSLNNYKSLRDVDKVEVTDDHEIKVTLNKPNSQFLEKIGKIRMVSPKALEDDDWDFGKESAGTGQYELVEWNHGESLVVEKNEDYWEEGHPEVDKITFKPTPEDGSRIASLKTGETDLIYPVPVNDIDSLKDEDDIDVDVKESTYVNYATLNTNKEPFDNKKVRQAMNYAIDQEEFINVVKNGYAKELDSILPKPNLYYSEQENYNHDLDKAKQLMKEAGYEDGFSTEIWGSDSSKDKLGMQFIQQQLEKIDIDVDIQQMERGTLDDQINKSENPEDAEVQMWYVGWSSTEGDVDNAVNPLFHSDSFPPNGSNTAYYDEEKVDKLIKEGLHATSDEEAKDKYAELQEIVFDDAPWLFLGTDEEATAKHKGLTGAWRSADGNLYLRDLKWE